jgi:hypothetical protein
VPQGPFPRLAGVVGDHLRLSAHSSLRGLTILLEGMSAS